MKPLRIVVPGPPVPWERTAGSGGRRFTPERSRAYKKTIRLAGTWAVRAAQMKAPWIGPCKVTWHVYLPDLRTRDWDNLGKAPSDGLNKIVWDDDNWIIWSLVVKHIDRKNPRMEIEVEFLEEWEEWVTPGRAAFLKSEAKAARALARAGRSKSPARKSPKAPEL